jgi:hypothetical protein
MSNEFRASLPAGSKISSEQFSAILHELKSCTVTRADGNYYELNWIDLPEDPDWPDIRVWIESQSILIATQDFGARTEELIWILEKNLSELLKVAIVFDDA